LLLSNDALAQRGRDSAIVRGWREARPDTIELLTLVRNTGIEGAAPALRMVLQTLTDRRRATTVRLAAIAALGAYLEPANVCAGHVFDTLQTQRRACYTSHPSYGPASSIEPILRDSIRARLTRVTAEPGAVGRIAAEVLADDATPDRWNETRADWCRRAGAAFAPALRMTGRLLVNEELDALAHCTETGPPALALAWRTVGDDSATLSRLVRMSAPVRDRRLYGALLAVARDSTRPVAVRVAAVDAVAPLLHPALYWFTSSAAGARSSCSAWGYVSHEAVQEEGSDPMGVRSRRAGVADLLALARGKAPSPVADAARIVAQCARRLLDASPPEMW
jgi:hypothetical protein